MKPLGQYNEGTFLKAEHLPGKENALCNGTVVGVRDEVLTGKDGKSQLKCILKFAEFDLELPLNVTNTETIEKLCGDEDGEVKDPASLVGVTFGMFVVPTPTGPGIRLRTPIPSEAIGGHAKDVAKRTKVKDADPRQAEQWSGNETADPAERGDIEDPGPFA